jgi:hypothetical protein
MRARLVLVFGLALLGCGDDDSSGGDNVPTADAAGPAIDAASPTPDAAPLVEPAGPWYPCSAADEAGATVVTAHNQVPQFWNGWEPEKNQRNVDADAVFPAGGPWERVFLQVKLECPADGQCDFWDRGADIALIETDGQPIELARYMTPYRVGMCFMADVTDFQERLVGTKKVRGFIDTWVGPASASGGHGWRITTKFIFRAGTPAATRELIPLWNNQAEDRLVDLANPEKPLATEMPARTVTIPAGAKKVQLRYLVTGHGQGNQYNCAEFCDLSHTTSFGDQDAALVPWRDDCSMNPVNNQAGTWTYPRAGWCPGAFVPPSYVDITAKVTPGQPYTFSYNILDTSGNEFINTCRPGAGGPTNTCEGCVFNGNPGNCDFNNNEHTGPAARISVQLVVDK